MEETKKHLPPNCALCSADADNKRCMTKEGLSHKGCPTLIKSRELEEADNEYNIPEVHEFARQASIQEASCYSNRHQKPYIMQPSKPRIIEICEFAGRMGYKKLGLAFCLGLAKEARVVEEIFIDRGFKVISILCKAGGVLKESIGLANEDKINRGTEEVMCNPIFQAKMLNSEKTEFNILLGLCVGHDSLFFKYSEAPTTVLAVKDRVTGHNPLAAIYLVDSYYRKIRHPEII